MKGLKKLFTIVATMAMMFSIIPSIAQAAPQVPQTTKVTIHKVVGSGGFQSRDHDGESLSTDEIAALGTNAVENNIGVQFTLWPVPVGTTVDTFKDMTDEEVTASEDTGTPILVAAGVVIDLGTGSYYVRETMRPATLKDSIGVPFILELPALNAVGTAYMEEVHLYPKNVIEDDTPVIDKDVIEKGTDSASLDVGDVFQYLIYPKVPKGIEDYTVFKVTDTLDSALDYMGEVLVKYNGVTFTAGTDYAVAESVAGTAGGSFTVTFTEAGLAKLAANRPETETLKDLEISFDARINATAVMGKDIYNNAILEYNNGYMTENEKAEVPNPPQVYTGGHKFIKVDNVTGMYNDELASATFVVKNAAGKYMNKDNNQVTWKDTIDEATSITVSAKDGSFEVTGLACGSYNLEEVTVPGGYVKMKDLAFTIDKDSYGSEKAISVTNVKRPLIPQTGGIGTTIFLVAGLAMMGVAVVALRKKEQPNS